jgi:phenylalanine-4-hydroxylase
MIGAIIYNGRANGTHASSTVRSTRTCSCRPSTSAITLPRETDDALRLLSRVFWFTFEFGVVEEDGELKAYGAGILSSFGELEAFRSATIRPLDFAEMARVEYDITKYQPKLFVARSLTEVYDALEAFLTSFSDETPSRLSTTAA